MYMFSLHVRLPFELRLETKAYLNGTNMIMILVYQEMFRVIFINMDMLSMAEIQIPRKNMF